MIDYSSYLNEQARNIKPSGIRRFFDIANEMDDVISLSIGEPDFLTPWHIREAGITTLEKGRTRYTPNRGLMALREEISHYLKRKFGLLYAPESEVLVTVGGSEAIDMALRCLVGPGEEVIIPKFEFARQMRNDARGTPLRLKENEIAIFEGIHALNDDIAGRHPQATKLYISARSNVCDGDKVVFKGTWMRLTRRAVRDYNFRGTDIAATLDMSPFKNKADVIIDSSLRYEVPVMKHYALPMLQAVPAENQRRSELLDLIHAFDAFEAVDPSMVAKDSLLREFIGGGSYKYH